MAPSCARPETVTTLEEMTKLIEQGFEYVTDTQIGDKTQKTVYSITEKGKEALDNFKEITMALQSQEHIQRKYVFI